MDETTERRRENLRDMWVSAISIAIAGLVLFPPVETYNYWPSYPEYFHYGPIHIGHTGLLVLMAILSIVLGGAIVTVENTRLPGFIAGGVIAYIAGMTAIELLYSPSDSPVHFLVYGGALVFFIIGAALATLLIRKDVLQRIFDNLFATIGF